MRDSYTEMRGLAYSKKQVSPCVLANCYYDYKKVTYMLCYIYGYDTEQKTSKASYNYTLYFLHTLLKDESPTLRGFKAHTFTTIKSKMSPGIRAALDNWREDSVVFSDFNLTSDSVTAQTQVVYIKLPEEDVSNSVYVPKATSISANKSVAPKARSSPSKLSDLRPSDSPDKRNDKSFLDYLEMNDYAL